jgi:hypothetical protein
MAKRKSLAGKVLVRVGGAMSGPAVMRRMGPRGAVTVALPHQPAELRQEPHAPAAHAAKGQHHHKTTHHAKKHATHHKRKGTHHSGSGSHHGMTDAEVIQVVLGALAGGPLRLAVEDIALQVFLQLQAQQQGAMQQAGSYQRMGGF